MEKEVMEKLIMIQKTQQEIVNMLRGTSTSSIYDMNASRPGSPILNENLKNLFQNKERDKNMKEEAVWIPLHKDPDAKLVEEEINKIESKQKK